MSSSGRSEAVPRGRAVLSARGSLSQSSCAERRCAFRFPDCGRAVHLGLTQLIASRSRRFRFGFPFRRALSPVSHSLPPAEFIPALLLHALFRHWMRRLRFAGRRRVLHFARWRRSHAPWLLAIATKVWEASEDSPDERWNGTDPSQCCHEQASALTDWWFCPPAKLCSMRRC